jgi:hypothetical protein
MKYLEEHQLEEYKYYHCITYDDDDIVVQYLGKHDQGFLMFSADLTDCHIRYVLRETEDLREARKNFI